MIDIPALVGQLNALTSADFRDDAERKSLYEAARAATFTSETPEDSVHRIANAVRYSHHNDCLGSLTNICPANKSVQTTVAKIAGDLGLFEIMGKEDHIFDTVKLADMTESNRILLGMSPSQVHMRMVVFNLR